MAEYAFSEREELFSSVLALLKIYWVRFTGKDIQENTCVSLRNVFFAVLETLKQNERLIEFNSSQIGRSIVYGGADGFLRLAKEHLLFQDEKAVFLAENMMRHAATEERADLFEDNRTVLEGILKNAILRKEAEFRARIGEEAGIAY